MNARKLFVARGAHDRRNSRTAMVGSISLILTERRRQEPAAMDFRAIPTSSRTVEGTCRRPPGLGQPQGAPNACLNINALLGEMQALLSEILPDNIRLVFELGENVHNVRWDKREIQRAIVDLCANAGEAMPEGGTLSIRTSNRASRGEDIVEPRRGMTGVLISVSDMGTGIEAEVREQIFDPFFTTKPGSDHTGLGLALVKHTVERRGGSITYVSEKSKGTTFNIFLPVSESRR